MSEQRTGEGESGSVVCVHGLWMSGLEMSVLRTRLGQSGFHVRQFSYPSVLRSPATHVEALATLVSRMPGPEVHLVGHSLGGLVILHLLHCCCPQRFGRAVLLGSPVTGSRLARRARRSRMGAWFLGRSWRGGLDGDVPSWQGAPDRVGAIGGTWGVGLAHYVAGPLTPPHDGVVQLDETRLSGAAHLALPVSHVSMLFSREVADATALFLRTGRFQPSPG